MKIAGSEDANGENGDQNSQDQVASGANSLAAFEQSVYPLAVENCGGCHDTAIAPFFASHDVNIAHTSTVDGNKVDFVDPAKSRLVLRLSEEQHNCWSGDCEKDAETMLAAIVKWIETTHDDLDQASHSAITDPLRLSDAQQSEGPAPTDTYIWEAENFVSIEAPMAIVQSGDASGGMAVHVPAGNGGRIVDLNLNNVGVITYQVDIKQAGTYKLYSRMRTPDGNSDSIFFSIDGAPFIYWTSGVNNNNFNWITAANGQNRLEYSVNLDVGLHTIRLRRREEIAQFDMFALSSNPTFNGGTANLGGTESELVFDLTGILGSQAEFRVKARKFDDFSFIFKDPELTLESGKAYVKSIYFLINGKRNPQAATYSIIDTEVSAPGSVLSDASMVQPFINDPDSDEIQVAFEIIEAR